MAANTAGLRIQRRRVEHIKQLMAEIADRQRIVAHLMTVTFRAGYLFLTLACLTAGLIGLVNGRRTLLIWGLAGVILALLWIGTKVSERVAGRVVRELRKELAKGLPDKSSDVAPAASPAGPVAAGPVAAPRRVGHHRIRPLS